MTNKEIVDGNLQLIQQCVDCQFANAHLTEITSPLIVVIKEWLKKIISVTMPR